MAEAHHLRHSEQTPDEKFEELNRNSETESREDKDSRETSGLSESDATHFRLRAGCSIAPALYTCYSCGQSFVGSGSSKDLLQIYEHYSETPHSDFYGNCFYCNGKVHRYANHRLNRHYFYHDCLRWKRGDDH